MNEFLKEEEGSQIAEFGLVILPLFAFMFLIMNVCWVIFAQACLQHAVREGVRFAITGQLLPGFTHQDDEIRSVVESNAFGFLSGPDAASKISIEYYNPSTLASLKGVGSNSSGNLLQITVSNVGVSPLAVLMGSGSSLSLSASSADTMEGSPGGTPPPR